MSQPDMKSHAPRRRALRLERDRVVLQPLCRRALLQELLLRGKFAAQRAMHDEYSLSKRFDTQRREKRVERLRNAGRVRQRREIQSASGAGGREVQCLFMRDRARTASALPSLGAENG